MWGYMTFLAGIVTIIWLVGAWYIWRKQTASRHAVDVHFGDRLIAIFWIPCYILFVLRLLLSGRGKARVKPKHAK